MNDSITRASTLFSLYNFVPVFSQVDITYKKPVLNLNLYDTTGEEDIFINQVLVDTGIAVFVENFEDQTGKILCNGFWKNLPQTRKHQSKE